MVWRNFSWGPANLGHPKQFLCQIRVVNVMLCMNHAISTVVRCLTRPLWPVNELQGCNHKLLMTLMVDITLFMSSFSIYVILLNLNVLLAVRNSSQY